MLPIAIREDHHIIGRNLSRGSTVPPTMKYARPYEYSECIPVSVVAGSNVVNGSHLSILPQPERGVMLRAAAALIFLCLATPAQAFNCDEVRAYVAQHGRAKAIAHAIRNGATWQQIREANKCLLPKIK